MIYYVLLSPLKVALSSVPRQKVCKVDAYMILVGRFIFCFLPLEAHSVNPFCSHVRLKVQ